MQVNCIRWAFPKNLAHIFLTCSLLFLTASCGRTPQYRYYEEEARPLPNKPAASLPPKKEIALALPAPLPKKAETGPLIVIDPGHGGKDIGTQSLKTPKYYEKNLTLSTSLALNQYLKLLGFKTVMTRDSDEFIELKDRALFANEKKPLLFVSVHFNSAPSKSAEGIEVYYYKSDTEKLRADKSKVLASKVLDGVLSYTKAKSRGVKHGNYLVIRETNMPAIIVEGGFMTNEEEMQKIRDGAYLKKLAWGIAQGIKKFAVQ